MATKKSGTERPASKKRAASPVPLKPDNRVALTVKVDHDVYVRLCTLAATQRRTNQDILLKAVEDFLQRTER